MGKGKEAFNGLTVEVCSCCLNAKLAKQRKWRKVSPENYKTLMAGNPKVEITSCPNCLEETKFAKKGG